jgi:hypothetical protein
MHDMDDSEAAKSVSSSVRTNKTGPNSHLDEAPSKGDLSSAVTTGSPNKSQVDGSDQKTHCSPVDPVTPVADIEAVPPLVDDLEKGDPTHGITFDDKPYSIFTHNEKKIIVLCAGFCAFFSPVSSSIYFPSLNEISRDLHVSPTLVNLSITTYLVGLNRLAIAFIN